MIRLATFAIGALLVTTPSLAGAPKTPLHLYVFTRTDASGLVDADQQRRMDSVRDLRGVLDKGLKRFEPVLVESPEDAHVVIEVLSSSKEATGDRTGWNPLTGFIGAGKLEKKLVVRARVSVGAYATEIQNEPLDDSFTWKMAAAHWQREFRKWANSNSEKLAELTRTQ